MKPINPTLALLFVFLAACATPPTATSTPTPANLSGIHKIQHVVVIMQENRSFDHYFGTYPGADGLPIKNGKFTVCVPNPNTKTCVYPYHDSFDLNYGGPHGQSSATNDINGGKMDGFIAEALNGQKQVCTSPDDPRCGGNGRSGGSDVMGYHDAREIPNYWKYAQDYVLQDHMFQANASWSLPQHLFMSPKAHRPTARTTRQRASRRPRRSGRPRSGTRFPTSPR
jgi:phospholipase C